MTRLLKLAAMASRSVRRHRVFAMSTFLSMMVGSAALALFDAYLRHADETFDAVYSRRAMLGTLIVEPDAAGDEDTAWLDIDVQQRLNAFVASRVDSVVTAVRFLEVSGVVSRGAGVLPVQITAYEIDKGAQLRGASYANNTVAGQSLVGDADREAAVIGEGLQALLACPADASASFACADAILQVMAMTDAGRLNTSDVRVVGISNVGLRSEDTQHMMLALPTAQELLQTHKLSRVSILLRKDADPEMFAAQLRESLGPASHLSVHPWQASPRHGKLYQQGMEVLGIFRGFVWMIVLATGLMAVSINVGIQVARRTREIGTLRALGFLPRHVTGLFVMEATILAAAGAVAGSVLATILIGIVNVFDFKYHVGLVGDAIALQLPWYMSALLRVASIFCITAMASAWWVARRAAKQGVTDALASV